MTALDFYKERLKDRGFSEKQIKDLTDHKDLPWLQFAEDYHTKQLILSGVSNCKTEPKLGKLETELGKFQEVHGEIVKYFDVHSGCDSFKFKDGAVYRVKLERSFGKATLD